MANTLRFKRGLASGIPTALAGEPLFTTDTFDLYIGNGTNNTRFQKYIASGATTQILRGDGSLYTFPLAISSPSNGQVLKYNGTSWVNDSDAGITGSGAAGQVAYFTGATTQGGSGSLFWDIANARLGIGTNTPSFTVDVIGTMRVSQASTFSTSVTSPYFLATGTLPAHQTNAGVFQYFSNGVSIRAYGATSGTGYIRFLTGGGGGSADAEVMRLHATGNLSLNSASDSGQRLQVIGTTYLSSTLSVGTTSANYTLSVSQNNLPTLGFIDPTEATDQKQWAFQSGITVGAGVFRLRAINDAFNNGQNAFIITRSGFEIQTHQWFTANTERMRLDASGNLGVGTITQTARIESVGVSGTTLIRATAADTNGNADVEIRSTGTTGASRLYFGDTAALSGSIVYSHATDAMQFSTAAALRMTLTTAGRLLLNQTSDTGEQLQVTGTARITGATTFGSSVIATGLISSATEFRLNNQAFSKVAILDAGGGFAGGYNFNLSGGTPQHSLTGAISGVYYGSGGTINFYTGTSQAAGTTATSRMLLDASGNLYVDTNTLFVDAASNEVGIGTTSPTAFLDVRASATGAASLRLRSGAAPTTLNDGDIWFDGTDLKMRIGGVTKTFTLV